MLMTGAEMARPDKTAGRCQLGNQGGNNQAGLRFPVEIQRQGQYVRIQVFSHIGQDIFRNPGLNNGNHVFEAAGQKHRYQINAAVNQEKIHFSQVDGFVDDPLLHLEGNHPCKNGNGNQQNQCGLKFAVSGQNP